MLERGTRDARPFGTRRGEDRAPAPAPRPEAEWDAPARPVRPLAWALRTAAVAGLVSLATAQYLARVSGPVEGAATRLARAGGGFPDPETTGSIGGSRSDGFRAGGPAALPGAARATRLDPCALAGGARPRP